MFSYTKQTPHPALRDYIRSYWIMEGEGVLSLDQLIPDGYPEIFFVLSGHLGMNCFANGKIWTENREGGLIGQATNGFRFELSATFKTLFIKIYPWTPHHLFGIDSAESINKAVDIGDFSANPEFRRLHERLQEMPTLEAMAVLLDQFFLQKVQTIKPKNQFVQHAIWQMYYSNGTSSIDSLTQNVRVSRRYVEKSFKQHIGFSPKHYAQILRVKKATMYMIDPRFDGKIKDIALSLQYYDQSHLFKDFKSVMGISPSAFMRGKYSYVSEEYLSTYLSQWEY